MALVQQSAELVVNGNTGNVVFPSNTTAGNLVAIIIWNTNSTGLTFTCTGFTIDVSQQGGSGNGAAVLIMSQPNIAGGVTSYTINYGSTGPWRAKAYEFDQVATSAHVEAFENNANDTTNNPTAAPAGAIDTTVGGPILVAYMMDRTLASISPPAGFTGFTGTANSSNLYQGYAAYQVATGASTDQRGAVTVSAGANYEAVIVAYKGVGGDTTPPTLTSPTGTGGTLTCSGTVSTNEANGTLYTSFTGSATAPTAVQVEAGQDHTGAAALRAVSQAVSATGTQTVASGSITAGTRYAHFMHKDAAGNRSTVVSSSSFTVTSGSTPVSFTGTVSAQSGTVGSAFSWTGSALSSFFSGSLTPFTYSVVTGSLPAGLTLNSSTGVVSGTPTTAGTYNATFRATDTGTNTANSNSVTFTIAASGGGTGTLTLTGFKQWTGTAWTSITVPFVKVCRASTGAVVLEVSSAAVNASGNMTITSGSLTAGVVYVVFGFNTDGTLSFKKTVTAA